MEFDFADDVFAIAVGDHAPTDGEWGELIDGVEGAISGGLRQVNLMVWTGDGNPTLQQRAHLRSIGERVPVRVAVVTESVVVKAAIRLFGGSGDFAVRAFGPDEFPSLVPWLGIDADRATHHRERMVALRARFLGGSG